MAIEIKPRGRSLYPIEQAVVSEFTDAVVNNFYEFLSMKISQGIASHQNIASHLKQDALVACLYTAMLRILSNDSDDPETLRIAKEKMDYVLQNIAFNAKLTVNDADGIHKNVVAFPKGGRDGLS